MVCQKRKTLIKTDVLLLIFVCIPLFSGCALREKRLNESNRHYDYGLFFLHAEDWEPAVKEFEKAVSLNKSNDNAFFGLGLTYYFQGNFEQAVKFYKKAIEINPTVPDYYNNISAAYAKLGKWEDVINYCQKALENPAYLTPEFAYYNIGSAYLYLGNNQKAVEFLKKSRDKNPNYIDINMQFSKALLKMEDYKGAIESLNYAKSLDAMASSEKEDPVLQAEIEYYLGQSYFGLGDFESAEKAFNYVIDKLPDSPLSEKSSKYLIRLKESKKDK